MATRSVNITPVTVIYIVLFAIDLYVFKGIKVLLSDMSSPLLRKIILTSHWVISIGLMLWFGWIVYNVASNPDFKNYKISYYLIGITLLVYLPKMVFSVFIFSDDIVFFLRTIDTYFLSSTLPAAGENISRLKFIYQLGAGIAAIPFVGTAYGMLKGRYDYRVVKQTVTLPNLPKVFNGLTLVQLSDLHLGSFFDNKAPVLRGLEMVKKINPDILVVTGDWVNNFSSEAENWIEEFKLLPVNMAKLAIVGNHDYGDYSQWKTPEDKAANFNRLLEIHREMGFTTLLNQNQVLEKEGEKIAVIGVENWGIKPFPQYGDLDKAKSGTEEIPVKILLSHDPTHFEKVVAQHHPDIDLTLSGHTHGAQFGVELGNVKWSPVKYKYPRWGGMYEIGHQLLYVNRGFGYLAFPGRIGMPPEITLFEFKNA